MKRTDPHRSGAIIPVDYVRVLWYALATVVEGWPQPAFAVDIVVKMFHDPIIKWSPFGGLGHCSICGARYIYGEVWKHEPTGEHIHVGHICAAKYEFLADRSEWEAWHETQKRERASAILKRERAAARDAFYELHPGLKEAFDLKDQHEVLRDMAHRLMQFGSLSEKQVQFALTLADRIRNPPPPERHIPAPTGRTFVQGKIVSIKSYDSQFGSALKMTVKVETPEGSWLVWTTVPSSLMDSDVELRGKTVCFTANLTRGNDPHFAFGKRPTGGRIVDVDSTDALLA